MVRRFSDFDTNKNMREHFMSDVRQANYAFAHYPPPWKDGTLTEQDRKDLEQLREHTNKVLQE